MCLLSNRCVYLLHVCKKGVDNDSILMFLPIIIVWATCIYYENSYFGYVYHHWLLDRIKWVIKVEVWVICKKHCTQLFINMPTGNINRSLTNWRSGMSTDLLMTWWHKCWSPLVLLFGLARIMMAMSSPIFWLKVSYDEVFCLGCKFSSFKTKIFFSKNNNFLWNYFLNCILFQK